MLHFLKDKGIATDEQLAPYIEQAKTASNVRWRAVHVRMKRLLTSAIEKSEKQHKQQEEADREKTESAKSKDKPGSEPGPDQQKSGARQEHQQPATPRDEAAGSPQTSAQKAEQPQEQPDGNTKQGPA